MKSRVVFGVLTVLGILGLGATAAQAGAGGQPFPITSFFVCQGINGSAPGTKVDVDGSHLGVNPQNVTLGNGLLACVVAKLFPGGSSKTDTGHVPCTSFSPVRTPEGCNEIEPPPAGQLSDGLKCYSTSGPKAPTSPVSNTFDITDELFPGGTELGVSASKFAYVCSPALFSPSP